MLLLFCWSAISDRQFQILLRENLQDFQRQLETISDIMDRSKKHFSEGAFLFATFMEFNKCWRSGKKSRLIVESVNGFAFINFSAYLGHPESMHVAPPEKRKPGSTVKRKPRKKSKKKTERDNVRAARFQAKKRQEKDAAASAASKVDPPPATSSPRAPGPSTFTFAEPTPENVSADSNFADMNIDGNATISAEHVVSQSVSADLSESNLSEEENLTRAQPWDGESNPTSHWTESILASWPASPGHADVRSWLARVRQEEEQGLRSPPPTLQQLQNLYASNKEESILK